MLKRIPILVYCLVRTEQKLREMVLKTQMAEEVVLKTDCSGFTSHSIAVWSYHKKLPSATGTPVAMAAVGSGEECAVART